MSEQITMNDSLEDILNNERINKKLHNLFSPVYYADIKKMFRKMKLKHMVKLCKTSWGSPFPAHGLLDCANLILSRRIAGELISIPIWKENEGDEDLEDVVLIPFLQKEVKNGPCVILCPGGSYTRVAAHREGLPVARELNRRGYQVFILNYRVNPCLYLKPQQDVLRAIRFVRANHVKLGIDPADIMLMGFSAGGHLCATAAALFDCIEDPTKRYADVSGCPDKLCLCYPVISFVEHCHEGSRDHLLGAEASDELKRSLSAELIVSRGYPKTFIWACADDPVVSAENTRLMNQALIAKHAACEMKIYPNGGHGIGLGEGTSAAGWLPEALRYLEEKPA